jgi:transcriptional regulator with XRE-family HTH domain
MTDRDAKKSNGTGKGRARSTSARPAEEGLSASVGQNVRAERERQGISVRELSRRLGVSASFLSQFELGQSKAAVSTLFAIASELNLSIDALLGNGVNASRGPGSTEVPATVDPDTIPHMPDYLALQSGVRWRRLANIPADHHVQFLLTEYEPGGDSAPGDSPQRHHGDDYGFVLEGTLTIEIDGKAQALTAGEAIHLRGDVPHRLQNLTDELVRAIWLVVG